MSRFPQEYAAGTTYFTVYTAVLQLASSCKECGEPLLHLCLERCCSSQPVFCYSCERHDHLCHQTNQLAALLVARKSVLDPIEHPKVTLMNTLTGLINANKISEELVEQLQATSPQYSRSITEILTLLNCLDNSNWYSELYNCVERYVTKKVDLKSSRKTFFEATEKINLHQHSVFALQESLSLFKDRFKDIAIFATEIFRCQEPIKEYLATTPHDLYSRLIQTSIQKFLCLNSTKNSWIPYRSYEIKYFQETTFDGERLIICNSNAAACSFPFLKELYTNSNFTYPAVKALGISIDCLNYDRPQLVLPPSVQYLSVCLNNRSNSYYSNQSSEYIIQKIRPLVSKLKRLCITSVYFSLKDHEIKMFVGLAIQCTSLRCMSIHQIENNDWKKRINYRSGLASNKHSYNRSNVAYFSTLAQISLMEKKQCIRNIPEIFKFNLLQAASRID